MRGSTCRSGWSDLSGRDGARHAGRRLADREDNGIENHPADADAGVLRRDRRLDHAVRGDRLGIPVSTTHTITGCIIGVGAAKRLSAVRWSVAKKIVIAWIITIPAAGLIAALCYLAVGLFG